MDQTMNYAEILTRVIREEAQGQFSLQSIKIVSACDRETGEFFMVAFGRVNKRRVDSILFHARLVDGKVIIETDTTEEGFKPLLIEAGIRPEDIAFTWNLSKPEAKPAAV